MDRTPGDLRGSLKDLAPFVAAAWLAWTVILASSPIDVWQYAGSVVLALSAGALALVVMSRGLGGEAGVVWSALLFLLAIGLLRNASGGMTSGVGMLALIPVFHTALHSRSRRALVVVLAGVALFFLLPIVFVGPPAYPQSQYRAALLSVAVSSIIGLATQRLVANVRSQAHVARGNEQMLELVRGIVHGLLDSPHVRVDVCQAALSATQAVVALLYEAGPNGLHCTAIAGVELDASQVSIRQPSAVYSAFASGRPVLITQDVEAWVGSTELWIASGRPASILCQPLLRDGAVLGVLAVGWPGSVTAEGPRATVAALLAHEAAGAISRADAMRDLVDEAQTDPLTGLPNRRSWDVRLARVSGDGRQFALAILDLDHFKQFNDTYGHPAGDRLLRETAAAWRDELRVGDVLARIGGEEFGLLLPDCDAATAEQITNRLRDRVSQGRTCSAGIAVRESGETADAVVVRADAALYAAKAGGRNRTHMSDPLTSVRQAA